MRNEPPDHLTLFIEPKNKDTLNTVICIGIGILAFLLGIAGLTPQLMSLLGL